MAVFDKASLVMIPSQYKEGKIYNIKPEDQSSSFEFERGSAATRVNSSGLIEQAGVGDIESVTNSNFDTTDNWITGSTTSSFTVTNGIATIQGDANSFNTRIGQTLSLEANKSYFIKVRIKSNDGNYWRIRGYDNISGYFDITNGNNTEFNDITYVYNAPSGMNGAPILYISSYFQNGTTDFSVDFASVKEINTDTPRLDYSGTEPALLLEPQRTNEVTYSQNFGQGYYFGYLGSTQTSSSELAPDGTNTAAVLLSQGQGKLQTAFTTLPANTTYTLSVWVKNIDATSYETRILANGGSGGTNITEVNRINEINTKSWTRVTHTFTTHTTSQQYIMYISNNIGSGESVQLWGAQLEQGSYATSYIPTNGQAETRLADVCQGGGDASVFNDSEGVLYAEVSRLNGDLSATTIAINKGGSEFSGFSFRTDGKIWAATYNGTSYENISQYTPTDFYDTYKICYKYKSNDFALWVNGVEVDSSVVNTLTLTGLNNLSFSSGTATNKFLGNVRALHYFPEALTDTELQQLTTI